MNFAIALTSGQMRGVRPADAAGTPAEAADLLVRQALASDVSDATRGTVAKATTAAQSLALVLGSPEFQKR